LAAKIQLARVPGWACPLPTCHTGRTACPSPRKRCISLKSPSLKRGRTRIERRESHNWESVDLDESQNELVVCGNEKVSPLRLNQSICWITWQAAAEVVRQGGVRSRGKTNLRPLREPATMVTVTTGRATRLQQGHSRTISDSSLLTSPGREGMTSHYWTRGGAEGGGGGGDGDGAIRPICSGPPLV